ncbi:MAG: RNA polymerase-binding protein RbpA [Mycobacteriales bacterium]
MSDRVLRGTRLGAVSYESDRHTEFAPRSRTAYDCPDAHATEVPFAAEAEIPSIWECRVCGAPALLRDGAQPEEKKGKPARTHWDMLLERRSPAELEEVLAERLAVLHEHQGKVKAALKSERAKERKSA